MKGMRPCPNSGDRMIDSNVLITSAGRRTGLVKAFLDATRSRGGTLLAADVDPLAPTLYLADQALQVPRVTNAQYIDTLTAIVKDHHVGLVVPTIDTELGVLAMGREQLEAAGAVVLVSAPHLITVCSDKTLTETTFQSHGYRVPRSWTPDQATAASLPPALFVKPRAGSASLHTYTATPDTLESVLALVPNPIVQEHIDAPEVTIDALLDLTGKPIHYVPRRRLRVLAGESIEGVTIQDDALGRWTEELLATLGEMGGRGPMTIQAFLTDSGPILLEVNPRFGGGFPLAHAAGASYPDWILDSLPDGEMIPQMGAYEVGLYMTRANSEIYVRDPKW